MLCLTGSDGLGYTETPTRLHGAARRETNQRHHFIEQKTHSTHVLDERVLAADAAEPIAATPRRRIPSPIGVRSA